MVGSSCSTRSPSSAGSAVATTSRPFLPNACSKENALQSSWIQRLRPAGSRATPPFLEFARVARLFAVAEQQQQQQLLPPPQRKRRLDNPPSRKIKGKVAAHMDSATADEGFEHVTKGECVVRQGSDTLQMSESSSCSGSTGCCAQRYVGNSLQEVTPCFGQIAAPGCSYADYVPQEFRAGRALLEDHHLVSLVMSPGNGDRDGAVGDICRQMDRVAAEQTELGSRFCPNDQDSAGTAIAGKKDQECIPQRIGWSWLARYSRNVRNFADIHGKSVADQQSALESESEQVLKKACCLRRSCECMAQVSEHDSTILGQVQREASGEAGIAKPYPTFSSNIAEDQEEYCPQTARAGCQIMQNENTRASNSLNCFAMDEQRLSVWKGKSEAEKVTRSVDHLLVSDRLLAEGCSDHNYVLTPIFEQQNPTFSVDKQRRITAALQNSESVEHRHKLKELSHLQDSLDLCFTPFKPSWRTLSQPTSDSSAATLPSASVNSLCRRVCSIDRPRPDEGSSHYQHVLRVQSSSSSTI